MQSSEPIMDLVPLVPPLPRVEEVGGPLYWTRHGPNRGDKCCLIDMNYRDMQTAILATSECRGRSGPTSLDSAWSE